MTMFTYRYHRLSQIFIVSKHTFKSAFTCWHCVMVWSAGALRIVGWTHWFLVSYRSLWRHYPRTNSSYERALSYWRDGSDQCCSLWEFPDGLTLMPVQISQNHGHGQNSFQLISIICSKSSGYRSEKILFYWFWVLTPNEKKTYVTYTDLRA